MAQPTGLPTLQLQIHLMKNRYFIILFVFATFASYPHEKFATVNLLSVKN